MSDNKQHHFCFAYHGGRMRSVTFDSLHFARAQGTCTEDGLQLVRVTLQRRNGRRAGTIPRILDEYNRLSEADPIAPVHAFGLPTKVTCFKSAHSALSNPILFRIEHDRANANKAYWLWEAKTAPVQSDVKTHKPALLAGLEGLVRELNLDPSSLCMQSAYDEITKASPSRDLFHIISLTLDTGLFRDQGRRTQKFRGVSS